MRIWSSIIAMALLGGIGALWFALSGADTSSGRGAVEKPVSAVSTKQALNRQEPQDARSQALLLGVADFMRNADRYEGTVRVQGVVSAADAESKMIALIDVSEFQACQATTCAPLILPVRWSKNMPKIAETVVVTGSVQEAHGKRILAASDLERVAPEPQSDR